MSENEKLNDLTLEKLEIHKRLASIESKFEVFIEIKKSEKDSQSEMFKKFEDHIDKLDHLLIGNGKPGVLGRLDKVEDQIKDSKENGKIAKVALFGVLAKFFFDFFFHAK